MQRNFEQTFLSFLVDFKHKIIKATYTPYVDTSTDLVENGSTHKNN